MAELHVVTGGAGFIGSHLADALLAAGHRVRVIDDFSTGKPSQVPPEAELVSADVTLASAEALRGADTVYHLAAQVSVPRSMKAPLESHRATESSTVAVLEAAEQAGVRRVVFASSSAVYGDRPPLPKEETHPPAPASPYAVAKWCGEIHARHWAEHRGLETVSLRFFNVYGPRQDPRSVYAAAIPIFLSRLLTDRPLPVYGDGQQTRDFTYVKDVVAGIQAAAKAPEVSGGVYNLASGKGTTVLDLIDALAEEVGTKPRLEWLSPRVGDIRHSRASIAAARRDLRYAPATRLRDGLAATVAWFRESVPPALFAR